MFVAFEGGDGAGKTTQYDLLVSALRAEGRAVCATRQPGDGPVGALIRQVLLEQPVKLDVKAEALLFAADRAQNVQGVIRPALAAGEVVVCDRFHDSSIAYQGMGRGLGSDVLELTMWAAGNLRPDLVVLLDIDPAVGSQRVGRRGPVNRLDTETAGFRKRVRGAFLQIAAADPGRYLVLDGTRDRDDLHRLIITRVRAMFDRAHLAAAGAGVGVGGPHDVNAGG